MSDDENRELSPEEKKYALELFSRTHEKCVKFAESYKEKPFGPQSKQQKPDKLTELGFYVSDMLKLKLDELYGEETSGEFFAEHPMKNDEIRKWACMLTILHQEVDDIDDFVKYQEELHSFDVHNGYWDNLQKRMMLRSKLEEFKESLDKMPPDDKTKILAEIDRIKKKGQAAEEKKEEPVDPIPKITFKFIKEEDLPPTEMRFGAPDDSQIHVAAAIRAGMKELYGKDDDGNLDVEHPISEDMIRKWGCVLFILDHEINHLDMVLERDMHATFFDGPPVEIYTKGCNTYCEKATSCGYFRQKKEELMEFFNKMHPDDKKKIQLAVEAAKEKDEKIQQRLKNLIK
jgi:hypothetical protein